MLIVPLRVGQTSHGLVVLAATRTGIFSDDDLSLLTFISVRLGYALHHDTLTDELAAAEQARIKQFVPRGTVHQPTNPGALPARFLLIFSPGDMGRFFADAAAGRVPIQAASSEPAALAALAGFSARYDFELAEFPAASA